MEKYVLKTWTNTDGSEKIVKLPLCIEEDYIRFSKGLITGVECRDFDDMAYIAHNVDWCIEKEKTKPPAPSKP